MKSVRNTGIYYVRPLWVIESIKSGKALHESNYLTFIDKSNKTLDAFFRKKLK